MSDRKREEDEELDYEVQDEEHRKRAHKNIQAESERTRDSDFIKRVTREAVKETLLELGIDVSHPTEIKEVQRDMAWIRDTRHGAERLQANVKRASVFAIVAAILAALWTGIKTKIGS